MSKNTYLIIFQYLNVQEVYRYGMCSKYLYSIVKSIKFDEFVEIKLDPNMKNGYYLGDLYKNRHLFPEELMNERPFIILNKGDPETNIRINGYYYEFSNLDERYHVIPDTFDIYLNNLVKNKNKNVKFKIMIDEVNDIKPLKFVNELSSADNLFYYFKGDFAMWPDEDNMNKPLQSNILHIKPRQLCSSETTFNTIFSKTKFIDELIMDDWREMTDISCLKDIKINKLCIKGYYMIENLHILKNCDIKDMFIEYPDMDWFWDPPTVDFLKSITKLEVWVMQVRRSRQGHSITYGTLEDIIPNIDVGYR